MVALSFQSRFERLVSSGAKRQTIRKPSKKTPAVGVELQLYHGMRTAHCRLLGRSDCVSVEAVELHIMRGKVVFPDRGMTISDMDTCNAFAQADGFADWSDLVCWFRNYHRRFDTFEGVLIRWGDLKPPFEESA